MGISVCSFYIELTVPWESNIPKDHIIKSNKFYDLTNETTRNGFKTQLYVVEVGARGIAAKSLHYLLKDLGLPRSAVGTFMDRVSKTALTGSFNIWLGREGIEHSEDYESDRAQRPAGVMWGSLLVFTTQMIVCQFATENPSPTPTSKTIEEQSTVTTFYALSSITPPSVMLRLGNSTIDSTKSFRVPQPPKETSTAAPMEAAATIRPHVVAAISHKNVPHVVSVLRNTYFDHDRRYGPTFEDRPDNGNITKITVQLGEDAHLNCRISLLQDKTVSWVRRKGRDEMPELLTVGAVTYAADDRISVGRRYPGNWKLLVREVKPEDEGVYECQISTHPPRVSKTYLHVNTPQVWVVDEAGAPLLEKYYEAESTLALVCRARYVEKPTVLIWFHEGKALNADTTRGGISVKTEQVPGGADSLLRLARVNSSDAGNYTCAVRGARAHTVSVHVLNEESLAELHAGASLHYSASTATLAFLLLLNLSRSLAINVIEVPVILAAVLTAPLCALARGLKESVRIILLPT